VSEQRAADPTKKGSQEGLIFISTKARLSILRRLLVSKMNCEGINLLAEL
jgi:hypothetical protein